MLGGAGDSWGVWRRVSRRLGVSLWFVGAFLLKMGWVVGVGSGSLSLESHHRVLNVVVLWNGCCVGCCIQTPLDLFHCFTAIVSLRYPQVPNSHIWPLPLPAQWQPPEPEVVQVRQVTGKHSSPPLHLGNQLPSPLSFALYNSNIFLFISIL